MKISELPKDIRKKALKYQKKFKEDLETDLLVDAFAWRKTKEGFVYWNDLDDQEAPKKKLKDTIVESVIKQFKQRSEVGINKYGVTLDREDLDRLQWLQHAQEEAMDLILYLEKLKQYESK
jgi:hypothetical protein